MWGGLGDETVTAPSCCRDGLRLKSKEGRESGTLEDMLCFTKVSSPGPFPSVKWWRKSPPKA